MKIMNVSMYVHPNLKCILRYDISFLTSATGAASKADLLDLQSAVDFTSDFVLLESIHRLVVCIFEALCLHRGFGGRRGGATPGKYVMSLRVVSCFQVSFCVIDYSFIRTSFNTAFSFIDCWYG